MPQRPVVLVTGCSSGIGRESVLHLRRAGALVVATARDPASLQELAGEGVEAMRLDVADDAERAAAVEAVLARHGRIDALVNNAGYGATLALEETTPAALQGILDVNVVGLHDLSRRVLPAMRRQGRGRIVNVASVAAHVPIPLLGAYCASKFAVRALTQALDMEVRRFGVRAVLVEPGPIATRFGARTRAERAAHVPDAEASPYAPQHRAWERRRGGGGKGVPASRVARRIVHASLARRPRLHYFVPASARWASLAKRALPDSWTMAILRGYFR